MGSWAAFVSEHHENDLQWRYDELHHRISRALGSPGEENAGIHWKKAKEILDFLSPCREFPNYYEHHAASKDGKRKKIQGSLTLCNLSDLVIESCFGYYGDEWIRLTLPNYVA